MAGFNDSFALGPLRITAATIGWLIFCSPSYLIAATVADTEPAAQVQRNRINDPIDLANPKSAIEQRLHLAKEGDHEAAYRIGKIYFDNRSNLANATPNAMFWLIYGYVLGNTQGSDLLQEFSRNGYRYDLLHIESEIKEELAQYSREHVEKIFPDRTYVEYTENRTAYFSWRSKQDLRAEAISELTQMKDVEICREALNIKLIGWDERYLSAGSVEEASRRNISIEKCKEMLTASAFKN